jgi:hypothetical protein
MTKGRRTVVGGRVAGTATLGLLGDVLLFSGVGLLAGLPRTHEPALLEERVRFSG